MHKPRNQYATAERLKRKRWGIFYNKRINWWLEKTIYTENSKNSSSSTSFHHGNRLSVTHESLITKEPQVKTRFNETCSQILVIRTVVSKLNTRQKFKVITKTSFLSPNAKWNAQTVRYDNRNSWLRCGGKPQQIDHVAIEQVIK